MKKQGRLVVYVTGSGAFLGAFFWASGHPGWGTFCIGSVLLIGALNRALGSLRADSICWSCGRKEPVGRLGTCRHCIEEVGMGWLW